MITRHDKPLQALMIAFSGIPESEAQTLASRGEVHSYPPGTVLCHEDAFETTFYIILEGQVKVTKVVNNEEVRLLQTLKAGDFFGEMALIQNAPRAATVTTTRPTTVLEIRKDTFDALMRGSASIALAMVTEFSRRLRENDAMAIEDLRIKAGELASAYQQLAEQEYARREFITTIAHELRTPLTAASGFLDMIQKGLLMGQDLSSEAQMMALQTASRNLQQIISLVNDIMFIQEMDLILPKFELVNLCEVIHSVARNYQDKLQEQGVELKWELPDDLPPVMGASKSLERAFGAILDNAVKFSPDGGEVTIRGGLDGEKVWVEVEDPGVGISEETLPRIFDRFFHVDQVDGRLFRGVGLGLSIARQVIEQHNGEIRVQSELGKGTKVRVLLNSEV